MKKVLFKKLQSLTAILVLNTVPVSFAQTNTSFSSQTVSNVIPVNERSESIGRRRETQQEETLSQLYLQNSLDRVKAHSQQQNVKSPNIHRYHVALAMVEEAYQDHFDDVLDTYEKNLKEASDNQNPALVEQAKFTAEQELSQLKDVRKKKIAEFSRQFGINHSV